MSFCDNVTSVRFLCISQQVTREWDVVLVFVLNSLSVALPIVFWYFRVSGGYSLVGFLIIRVYIVSLFSDKNLTICSSAGCVCVLCLVSYFDD